MAKKINKTTSELLMETVVEGMREKKANDILSLDLTTVDGASADYFVISHATSSTQVRAIADSVDEWVFKHLKQDFIRREGFANAEWIILDYGDVVAHIFREEKREFYSLEDVWKKAERKLFE